MFNPYELKELGAVISFPFMNVIHTNAKSGLVQRPAITAGPLSIMYVGW